jgi:mRNA-degrading endonuclease RelE of RelBE toxin-antitoxin system
MRRLAGVPLAIEYTNSARKELLRLDIDDADILKTDLEILARTGLGEIEPLEDTKGVFRLRSGRTQAEFFVMQQDHILTVIRIFYHQQGYGTKGRSRR